MEMNKFRPQDINARYIIKERRLTGRAENYNWQTRAKWYPAGWKVNHISIGRRFGHLHYLACHAPAPVRHRWRSAYQLFEKRYFASAGRASIRYLNTRTAHAWL